MGDADLSVRFIDVETSTEMCSSLPSRSPTLEQTHSTVLSLFQWKTVQLVDLYSGAIIDSDHVLRSAVASHIERTRAFMDDKIEAMLARVCSLLNSKKAEQNYSGVRVLRL